MFNTDLITDDEEFDYPLDDDGFYVFDDEEVVQSTHREWPSLTIDDLSVDRDISWSDIDDDIDYELISINYHPYG